MTPEQEAHLQSIKAKFNNYTDKKYRAGQKEHGGNLWEKSEEFLLEAAIDEAIDQVTYLVTLYEKRYGKTGR